MPMTLPETLKVLRNAVPNILSGCRALLGLIIPFVLITGHFRLHITAMVIFIIATLTDYWDGWYARHYDRISPIGKILDPTADKVLVLASLMTFAYLGFYSIWWIIPILIRELVVTFCRIGWMLEGKAVGAETLGKWKFAAQVAAVLLSFSYLISIDLNFSDQVYTLFHGLTSFVLLVAVALTLVSGVTFLLANRAHFQSRDFAKFVSALGIGLIPIVPGTLGSFVGLAIACFAQINVWLYVACFASLLLAGRWSIMKQDLAPDADPGYVVIDEAAGMMVALFCIKITFTSALAAFLIFRILDVLKPFPLRRLEKLHGYRGIMADDLGAGFYSWLMMYIFF